MQFVKKPSLFSAASVLMLLFFLCSCSKEEAPFEQEPPSPIFLPATDPANNGNWMLNTEVSDEFETAPLDEEKWLIQGRDGEYKSNFIGRAPSQFSTENVRIEDGKLKIQTKWDSDFDFSSNVQTYSDGSSYAYENITTAAVISRNFFYHGYMEIKCKAADASVSSSFWMTGSNSELDVFEFIGNPAQDWKGHLKKELKSTIHDWAPGKGGQAVWSNKHELDWDVASDFHVYGCEWDSQNLKFYADGVLIKSVTKAELGEAWVLNGPLWIWVDSETFPWHGVPAEEDLSADFEIEYIRVWQKN